MDGSEVNRRLCYRYSVSCPVKVNVFITDIVSRDDCWQRKELPVPAITLICEVHISHTQYGILERT
jgi:hypothetical protein